MKETMNMSIQNKSWIKNKVNAFCKKLERSILANKTLKCQVVYGPVRSRRLGLVLGVNNIKQKLCSYDCIYCPSGRTSCCSICTNYCLSPYELFISVKNKIHEIEYIGKKIDYILFAGNGDPILDSNLDQEIKLLREFGYKIAVFTNSSMLWNENIQENLLFADYVSVKIDTVNENTWLRINRPHKRLKYNLILDGIEQFSKRFQGKLTTETTLIKNFNDNVNEIEGLASYLNSIKKTNSYFMTPIYPPAETYAISPDSETLDQLSKIIKEKIKNSVLLCCPENDEFFATDDFENELLGLLSIHPVNVEAVRYFAKDNHDMQKLKNLIDTKIINETDFNGKKFLMLNHNVNQLN